MREEAEIGNLHARVALRDLGDPEFPHGVTLSFHVRRSTLMDRDNVIRGMKAIQDGLCNRKKNGYGLVEEDDALHLDYGRITFEIGRCYAGSKAEVEITAEAWEPHEVAERQGVRKVDADTPSRPGHGIEIPCRSSTAQGR